MRHVLLLLLFIAPAQAEERWPGFLGAGATAVSPATIPVHWSPSENIAWSIETPGYGQSAPVVWGDRIFITAIDGPDKESLHVVCCSLQTGAVLWDHKQPSSHPQKSSVYISRAAPTPVVDERGVYAYFESGDVVALTHDGSPHWSASLTERYGAPQNKFGLAASPVQTDEHLIILVDDEGPSYLAALDKANGEEAWKTDRKSRKSWSSPMPVSFGTTLQAVCSSDGSIDGYDVQTGQQLWTFDEVGGNTGTSPVPVGDGAFLIGASPGRDGENAGLAKQSNGLFVVTRDGDAWQPRFAWKNPAATPSWASPILHQGFAYWVNRTGAVFCIDFTSGQLAYIERIKQSCWATPVGIGEHVYFFGKDGVTTVLAAGPEFQVVAENELWSADEPPVNRTPAADEETEERRRASAMFSQPTVYGVAIVNGYIVLRTGSQLFCIHAPVVASR